MLPNLIGISGALNSGKDSVAKIMLELLWEKDRLPIWKIKKFAEYLKDMCLGLCQVPDFEHREYKNRLCDEWGMTGREVLQTVGSLFRDHFDKDVWVKLLFRGFYPDDEYCKWIISDLRYANEFDAIKSRGGICIRVDRPNLPEDLSHTSETEWRNLTFDYAISNDGTLDDLREKVKEMITYYELKDNWVKDLHR